jgi:hypothetical protein
MAFADVLLLGVVLVINYMKEAGSGVVVWSCGVELWTEKDCQSEASGCEMWGQ